MVALNPIRNPPISAADTALKPRKTPPNNNPFPTNRIRSLLRARYYDPHSAEFLSPDPLEYVDGMSLYRAYFVPGGIDPLGLCSAVEGDVLTQIGYIPLHYGDILMGSTGNPDPPDYIDVDVWDQNGADGPYRPIDHIVESKEFRNIHQLKNVKLTCEKCGDECKAKKVSWTTLQHVGFTPQPPPLRWKGFLTDEGIYFPGRKGKFEHDATISGECATITSKVRFQVNVIENLGQSLMNWSLMPYAWSEITHTVCCDGTKTYSFSGSVVPPSIQYVNGKKVGGYQGDWDDISDDFFEPGISDDAPRR